MWGVVSGGLPIQILAIRSNGDEGVLMSDDVRGVG